MAKFISPKMGVSVGIVSMPVQNVMTFGQDWMVIYLYSLPCGIVVTHLISLNFGTDKFRLYVSVCEWFYDDQ